MAIIVLYYLFWFYLLLNISLLLRYRLFLGNAQSLDTKVHQVSSENKTTKPETKAAIIPQIAVK
jgi:hypothetical protein